MAQLLRTKLTEDELVELFEIIDEDADGDLWDALGEQVERIRPEIFGGFITKEDEFEEG